MNDLNFRQIYLARKEDRRRFWREVLYVIVGSLLIIGILAGLLIIDQIVVPGMSCNTRQ
jgi:hypothetical protein